MASSKNPATRHLVKKAPSIAVKTSPVVKGGTIKAVKANPMKGTTKPMGKKGC